MGDAKAIDGMINDGLTNPFSGKHMMQEASEVAAELELTRPDMDRWALRSHELAIKATDEGRLPEEIVRGDRRVEEGRHGRRGGRGAAPRHLARVARQAAADVRQGRLAHRRQRAGRQRRRRRAVPGLGGMGQASRAAARSRRIVASAEVADDFAYLARTPAKAAKLALEKAGLKADEIDLWEINEAFASVAINSVRMLGIDDERVNVNGGAIALGHPIGASGARILMTLVHELRRRGGGLGVAAICSGGGQGDAVIVEVNGN